MLTVFEKERAIHAVGLDVIHIEIQNLTERLCKHRALKSFLTQCMDATDKAFLAGWERKEATLKNELEELEKLLYP